jgi:hypothetical protein
MSVKKYKVIFTTVVLIVFGYVLAQYLYLKLTNKAPFSNLLNEKNENCLIYFNIKYQGREYPIFYQYHLAEERFTTPTFRFLAPLYFNELIRYDLSINVDDSVYSELKHKIIDKSLVNAYIGRDLVSEGIAQYDNTINKGIDTEHRKAIIYCLLKQGTNCCVDDESGDVYIIDAPDE